MWLGHTAASSGLHWLWSGVHVVVYINGKHFLKHLLASLSRSYTSSAQISLTIVQFTIVLVLVAQLFAFATASVSTYSQSFCATRLTSKKPASVPTSTSARTSTFKPKVTTVITNTRTVTPTSASVTSVTTSISSTTTTITQVLIRCRLSY
jgi:hypothetical protein